MRELALYNLKRQFTQEAEKDREFRSHMHGIFLSVFGSEIKLKELSLTSRAITLTADNKSFAQELFLQKSAIQTHLEKHTQYAGKDLVIR